MGRIRLFHNGEHLATLTGDRNTALDAAPDGAVVYIDDLFYLVENGSLTPLHSDDARVQGLYGKAVRAESTPKVMYLDI